jgi:clan AA aspartic protease
MHATVTLTLPGGSGRAYTASFLVDTGATDSMAPASELRRVGIKPIGNRSYKLANGEVMECPFGLAQIEVMGEVTAGRVIFGPEGTEPILGVTALESVGITVDPAHQTLRRLPAIPLKQVAPSYSRVLRDQAAVRARSEASSRNPSRQLA